MKIVYDAGLRRPACPLLQAALGGDSWIAGYFPSRLWLLAPTPDMKLYRLTEEQLLTLLEIKLCLNQHSGNKPVD